MYTLINAAWCGILSGSSQYAFADPDNLCQSSTFDNVFLVEEGREDLNTTISGPTSVHQRNAIQTAFRWRVHDGPTLNTGLVAL